MTYTAKQIMNQYNNGITDPVDILALDIGDTENEVSFIIAQLKCKGFLSEKFNQAKTRTN